MLAYSTFIIVVERNIVKISQLIEIINTLVLGALGEF